MSAAERTGPTDAIPVVDGGGKPSATHPRRVVYALIPVVLALVMAAPSLRGGFLSGDDIQLVRDHVLVNRPSATHLVELFSIPHRDLYQPIPLASFSFDFVLLKWLGLMPTADGPHAGAWIFHLSNMLIHAVNALLVWWLVVRLSASRSVAVAAAVLFAIHPLNVECVAWICGRMMLLSTLFALVSLIAAARVYDRPGVGATVLSVLAALATMMSKVCIGLPVLMLLIPFVRGRWPVRRWWMAFALVSVVTGLFVGVNLHLSQGLLDSAKDVLEGPRLARTVIALGWYATRYFAPTDLAPWHPTATLVTWSDPLIPARAITVAGLLIVAGLLVAGSRRNMPATRGAAAGAVWFFATVAVVLPLVLSRNLMVAERYMYLPAIGVHAIMAICGVDLVSAVRHRCRWLLAPIGVSLAVIVVVLIGLSWRTAGYYRDNVSRCLRTARLYPKTAGVWTRVAWAHYDRGEYDQAILVARVDLEHHPQSERSDVWQVQGMALLRAGDVERAIAKLAAAAELDPDDGTVLTRLATALGESGRLEEAIPHYRRALALLPSYNPAIIGLAQAYRRLGRPDDAAEMFALALKNNRHDPIAITNLAELEIFAGDYKSAMARLEGLLAWMPDQAGALANLGLCYTRLGRLADAEREYRAAVASDPGLVPARLNLAQLLSQRGATEEADAHLRVAVEETAYRDSDVLLAYSDHLVARGDLRAAAELWTRGLVLDPKNRVMTAWYGWVCALAGHWSLAGEARVALGNAAPQPQAAVLTGVLLDVHANRPEPAIEAVTALCLGTSADVRTTTNRLKHALKAYSLGSPENPWPYYMMALLFRAEGHDEGVEVALQAFRQVCTDPEWVVRAEALAASPSSQPDR